ncbi:MAG: hypothetical protein JXB46_10270, partial [Candidatus Eisenbacteria bacterium]|nr:hypothetical protein [Candidatus Eisenbacteria bacterium]
VTESRPSLCLTRARTAGRRIGYKTLDPVDMRVRPAADSRTPTLHGRAVVVSIAVVVGVS